VIISSQILNYIQMDNSNKFNNLAGTFLVGAAIGGILGVLFAPKKGSDTRRQIAETGENFATSVKDQYDNIVSRFSNEIEDLKTRANHVFDKEAPKPGKA
jgi:gas vesicle protein